MFLEALSVSFFQEIYKVQCPIRLIEQADKFFLNQCAVNGFAVFAFPVIKPETLKNLTENKTYLLNIFVPVN